MTTPTITSISPAGGQTGGKTLVTIVGANFRLPRTPASTGPTAAPSPTVRVTFGGREASRVCVLASTQLTCLTPIGDAGARTVVLTNLDNAGDPITGESVTRTGANGFAFARPSLAAESYLQYVVRALLQEWRRQVLENVSITTHTDFDADTADKLNTVAVAALPAIIFVGPQMVEDRFYSINVKRYPVTNTGFNELSVPFTVDLFFDVILLADTEQELLNLAHHATRFVDRNDYLEVPLNFADPAAGTMSYEMDSAPSGEFTAMNLLNLSNVRQMSGRVIVRGVHLDEFDPVVGRSVAAVDITLAAGIVDTPAAVGFDPDGTQQISDP
jgi:hypothetical protein